MTNEQLRGNQDLILAPGEYAYVLDTTKGQVVVYSGPFKTSMAGTDQPVYWDTQKKKFERCQLDRAIQIDLVAPEGFYLVLYNPAKREDSAHPGAGKPSASVDLNVGHRVNIPGPATFPLWPGQFAEVVRGHHTRSNQYIVAQVYNADEATENWGKAVVKPATESGNELKPETPVLTAPKRFTPGQLMIVKGTDVSFFIPPTGIKVVPESGKNYVREAVTLERLEYCILLNENGTKRFVQGPNVVFPEPTETFVERSENEDDPGAPKVRKFRAIELNETTGLYIKVVAPYEEDHGPDKGKARQAGDELFITGKDYPIYFQREEHVVIRYGEQTKHYAVAVPAGEGRYVLNRVTGEIKLVRGPVMLLPDPRTEVIVRRVLSQRNAALWYPNNQNVLAVNKELDESAKATGSVMPQAASYDAGRVLRASNYMAFAVTEDAQVRASRQVVGDTFSRGTKFTPPRTLTLDTKYEGAVAVNPWPGYAVLVLDKEGNRRVVEGPQPTLLEYDETLAVLTLSTGKPKSTDKLLEQVYLRVKNNAVSDIITVETKDLVKLNLHVSYRVNFEGDDKERWFAVENYVALLCDHTRSLVRNTAKRHQIEEFYERAIDIVRDTVLGVMTDKGRAGRLFAENNMRIYDLEVVDVQFLDPKVSQLLSNTQVRSLEQSIKTAEEERNLAFLKRVETVARKVAEEKAVTVEQKAGFTQREVQAQLDLELDRADAEARRSAAKLEAQLEEEATLTALHDGSLGRERAAESQRLELREREDGLVLARLVKETEELVKRANAVSPSLAAALTAFASVDVMKTAATALAPLSHMSGTSAAEILAKLFKGTQFAGVLEQLATRPQLTGKVDA